MQRQLNPILNGKGGGGKSFFAVNFIQYLKDQQIQHTAIDTDNENSTLKRFHPEARFVNLANARELDELVAAVETVPLVVVDCRAAPTDLFLAYFAELAVFGVLKSIDTVLTVVSPVNHDLDRVEQVRILPSYGIRHAVRTEPWQPVGSAHSCSSSSHHLELSGAGERPASRKHRSAIATRPRSPVARITCAHWMSSRLARRRIRKGDLLSHCRRVLVTQMTVRLHCQCAAVFVS